MDSVLITIITLVLCIIFVVFKNEYQKEKEKKRKADYQAKLDKMTPVELDHEMKRLQKESERIMYEATHRSRK